MTTADITRLRLINQQIATTKFKKPHEIVAWMGAMQAQDFGMAKWAIGLRLPGLNDADIEKAFNDGKILRTHLMRPTWHFVTPADIRWILSLTSPRVNAFNAAYYRKCELDTAIFKRSNDVLAKTLQDGKQLPRVILKAVLERAKIKADGLRLGLLFMRAELDGIICSGARQGKQFTYALLDERAPAAESFYRQEALAELTRRYFTTRGPATLHDFAWWSGLTINDARSGVSMSTQLKYETINGQQYVLSEASLKSITGRSQKNKPALPAKPQTTFLLPDYDEYGISYKDRSALFKLLTARTETKNVIKAPNAENPTANHMIVVNGLVGGTWQRIIKNNTVTIETSLFTPLSKTKHQAVIAAVKKYKTFIGKTSVEKGI